jgi:hypothetical protein
MEPSTRSTRDERGRGSEGQARDVESTEDGLNERSSSCIHLRVFGGGDIHICNSRAVRGMYEVEAIPWEFPSCPWRREALAIEIWLSEGSVWLDCTITYSIPYRYMFGRGPRIVELGLE